MNHKQLLVSAAVAGLLASGAHAANKKAAAGKGSVQCVGGNACKGQGECHSADGASCKGSNACKGKGWVTKASQAECDAAKEANKH